MNKCLNCGKEVKNKFCNTSCQNKVQWKGKKKSKIQIEQMKLTRLEKWKTFNVNCCKCKKEVEIKEYNVDAPKKEKYYCSRSCANSRNWTKEDKLKKSDISKKSKKVKKANKENGKLRLGKYYNEGICKKRIERVISKCLHCDKDIEHKINEPKKYHKECWIKCSGGYREGSSRGKNGWYKGYWCDSSWELAWVIYNLEHGIKFERNKIGFEYIFKDKKSLFYPDFIVKGNYVEIKNFNSKRLESKLEYFPHKIKVLYKKDLKNIFDYVIDKYGKNYIELYEKK